MCAPLALGQLLILLQYQTLAQRIKVMVRKAENLFKLTRIPGAPGKDPNNPYDVMHLDKDKIKPLLSLYQHMQQN